ncbi:hypothetical protein OV203_02485 [Nannocystis sp. ILAH1]|uniref:hypothetical protein n=1 Tax=Nannocystis sp. ILAH1 TaxID=2996789 RepID=UPI00226E5D26|nr:hypothetical protein [Nannocystis sp. ILAH1]MCY0985979.1 hypothetical protein [Nannocystis sp. ILAH1]
MAANPGYNKTSQNDLVQGVNITLLAEGIPHQPRIYQEIALIGEPTKPVWRVVTNNVVTVNTTLAEADEAGFTSFTTDGVDITPAIYPVRSHVSLELQQDTMDEDIDVINKAITEHMDVLLNAADANVLANISSASNTSDHTGEALDKDKFRADLLLFKKQAGRDGGEIIFVGSYRQVHDVIGSYADAGGSAYAVPGVVSSAVASDPSSFLRGNLEGVPLLEGAVPANGGSDVSGCFMIRRKAIAIGYWILVDYKITDPAGRVGDEVMTWSRYGTGIVKQANLREVISLA